MLGKINKEKCKLKLKFTKLSKEINERRKKQLLLKENHNRAKELSAKLTLLAGELRELVGQTVSLIEAIVPIIY